MLPTDSRSDEGGGLLPKSSRNVPSLAVVAVNPSSVIVSPGKGAPVVARTEPETRVSVSGSALTVRVTG